MMAVLVIVKQSEQAQHIDMEIKVDFEEILQPFIFVQRVKVSYLLQAKVEYKQVVKIWQFLEQPSELQLGPIDFSLEISQELFGLYLITYSIHSYQVMQMYATEPT